MSVLTCAELRDLAAMDCLADEIKRQTNFLRLNMAEEDTYDRIRFLTIAARIDRLMAVSQRCERRYERDYQARQKAAA